MEAIIDGTGRPVVRLEEKDCFEFDQNGKIIPKESGVEDFNNERRKIYEKFRLAKLGIKIEE